MNIQHLYNSNFNKYRLEKEMKFSKLRGNDCVLYTITLVDNEKREELLAKRPHRRVTNCRYIYNRDIAKALGMGPMQYVKYLKALGAYNRGQVRCCFTTEEDCVKAINYLYLIGYTNRRKSDARRLKRIDSSAI